MPYKYNEKNLALQEDCESTVIFCCRENYKRLTKLEYLVLLIIKDFGNIQLQDKETKEYYWPDMSECVSHYLRTEKFDEVLEVVIEELFHKKLLATNAYFVHDYIKLKLNEIQITEAFDGGIIYDKFKLAHKYYKPVDDQGKLNFIAVPENRLPIIKPSKKHKGAHCLGRSIEELEYLFHGYINSKYPDHKDDIIIDTYVYPYMLDYDEDEDMDVNSNDIENTEDEFEVPY